MNAYNFNTLNDKEFESLAADALGLLLAKRVERFKPGKDKGVDGRFFAANGAEAIVQCKHWPGSTLAALLRHLKQVEAPKVQALEPKRYIFVCSHSLSRQNKEEMQSIFHPFVHSSSDIIGAEDLNDLLAKHSELERRHYKLWITSSCVLQTIINNAIVGRSLFAFEQFQEEAAHYVFTSDHAMASEYLHKRHAIILTGDPGIGKTTLARQLVLECTAEGYSLVVIEEDLSEAEAVFSRGTKQVFYFDDFLGRNYLETLRAKQDSHLVGFLDRVGRDPSKRFILTSRTNILNQGRMLSDLLSTPTMSARDFELSVAHLTLIDRARLVYTHLWHSALSRDYIDQIYTEKRYRELVKHTNFNPRLISFVLDAEKLSGLPADRYWPTITSILENPEDIWENYFSVQMSLEGRSLVALTTVNGRPITETLLRQAFLALPAQKEINAAEADHRFRRAIRECVGSALTRSIYVGGSEAHYSLFNPSIGDYFLRRINTGQLWRYYFSALRTESALTQIEQLKGRSFFADESLIDVLAGIHDSEAFAGNPLDGYNLRACRIASCVPALHARWQAQILRWLGEAEEDDIWGAEEDYFGLVVGAGEWVDATAVIRGLTTAIDASSADGISSVELSTFRDVLVLGERLGALQSVNKLRDLVISHCRDEARSLFGRDLGGHLDSEPAIDALQSAVIDWLSQAGIEPSDDELGSVVDRVDIDGVVLQNRLEAAAEDDDRPGWAQDEAGKEVGDTEIDDLFERDNE